MSDEFPRGPEWLWNSINAAAMVHDACGDAKRWILRRTWCKWRGHKYRKVADRWKFFFMPCQRCGYSPILSSVAEVGQLYGFDARVGGNLAMKELPYFRGAKLPPLTPEQRNAPLIIDYLDESASFAGPAPETRLSHEHERKQEEFLEWARGKDFRPDTLTWAWAPMTVEDLKREIISRSEASKSFAIEFLGDTEAEIRHDPQLMNCPRCTAPLVQSANGIDFGACEYCDFGKPVWGKGLDIFLDMQRKGMLAGGTVRVHGVSEAVQLNGLKLINLEADATECWCCNFCLTAFATPELLHDHPCEGKI